MTRAMHPEAQAMLEAIRARPNDDAVRLIYADWRTAQGDPLGEFVSIQCRLAAAPEVERRKLRVRENQLLKAHSRDWLEPVLQVLDHRPLDLPTHEFVRGFLASLTVPTTVLPRLDALFALAPVLEELTLRTPLPTQSLRLAYPSIDEVAHAPQLSRLTRLAVTAPAGDRGAAALAECSHLSNLRALRFTGSVWGDDARLYDAPIATLQLGLPGVRSLVTSPHLRGLRALNLSNNLLGNAGAIATLGWQALEELELRYSGVGQEFLLQLAKVGAPKLRALSLAGGLFDEASLVALASASRALPALEELDLEKCDLGADTLAAFFKALSLPKLRSLRLERNRLGEKGALALAASPGARQFDNLELGHNRIGQKGAAALASSPHLAGLTRLTLNDSWKPETVALFAKSPTLAAAKVYFKGKLVPKA